VGGVFVAEALSVMLQVAGYRLTGKRIFRCAPLHHHFEFQGWPETRIVVRFWIASALCAMLGLVAMRCMPELPSARRFTGVVETRVSRGAPRLALAQARETLP
jgi:hypothetical protein